ncbi:unnamed protein product [Nesidiocoris tenuis]|uniref:Uncharacterized protein n=1 Tax=Nesidiocoris tenuis TaxID=355587 RepID=A0A6H5H4E4_9HEMI|nr:unnamed protein product [Nesidiocoris tenuis]
MCPSALSNKAYDDTAQPADVLYSSPAWIQRSLTLSTPRWTKPTKTAPTPRNRSQPKRQRSSRRSVWRAGSRRRDNRSTTSASWVSPGVVSSHLGRSGRRTAAPRRTSRNCYRHFAIRSHAQGHRADRAVPYSVDVLEALAKKRRKSLRIFRKSFQERRVILPPRNLSVEWANSLESENL